MKAKLIRESLNEDYYKEHGLNIYDKIVDYVIGISDFVGSEEEKEALREEYKNIILNSDLLRGIIERAEQRGEAESIEDIVKLGKIVYNYIEN